jgi:uncharacterized protein YfdQ (DUF2303 family)
MTETDNRYDGHIDGVSAALDAGIQIAGPQPLKAGDDRFFTQLVPAGSKVETFDREALEAELEDRYAAHPRRKTGTVHVQDALSFIEYIGRHRIPATEVFADLSRMGLVGVINGNGESVPDDDNPGKCGHGDHRVILELMPTDAWKVWTARDKTPMGQSDFAEHLEDNAGDVVHPDAATMLEVAQSLLATTSADFKSAIRLDNGEVQFRYEETITARAGQAGDLGIPATFTIALAPFEGCDPVEVVARFRYRINGDRLVLSYALLNPQDIARRAFLDHVDAVRNEIEPPIFHGRPA